MRYLRKVSCAPLNLSVIFEDQAHALSLFTKLYDNGYAATTVLEDYFIAEDAPVQLDDSQHPALMDSIGKA